MAVLGILIVNIEGFGRVLSGYMNPTSGSGFSGLDQWVWGAVYLFADTKFISIFSLLFGAGIAMMSDRAARRGVSGTGLHYRRQFLLLLIGLLHAYLIWHGDILVSYALCGFILYPLRNLSARWLLLIGSGAVLFVVPLWGLMGMSMPYWPEAERLALEAEWAPSAEVLEANDGLLSTMAPGKIWMEMSTTDEAEVRRLGAKVVALGGEPVDCPVSGGCHRAGTGNISIFAGCERSTFERILPLLTTMGRRILHTGPLGSASILKVITNYLATANLVSCCEALVTAKAAGMDLNTTWEAMRISSGNSFVHETESQVILNGSRDISFTMDLVRKDIGLFQAIADRCGVPVELNPVMVDIFKDGAERYGPREWSPNIIRRLEDATGLPILAPGFPAEMVDDEPEEPGHEVIPKGRD